MSRIFCVTGKSASGKDSIFQAILEKPPIPLSTVVTYTTRPIRDHETDGVEYFFTDTDNFEKLRAEGKIIEFRCYHTVHGDWYYFTVDDGQIRDDRDYLIVTDLHQYESLVSYFGSDRIVPLYVEIDDGIRLTRALEREKQQAEPKYAEMCRRFLADNADFSEENILRLGIKKRYINDDFASCVKEMCEDIVRLSSK